MMLQKTTSLTSNFDASALRRTMSEGCKPNHQSGLNRTISVESRGRDYCTGSGMLTRTVSHEVRSKNWRHRSSSRGESRACNDDIDIEEAEHLPLFRSESDGDVVLELETQRLKKFDFEHDLKSLVFSIDDFPLKYARKGYSNKPKNITNEAAKIYAPIPEDLVMRKAPAQLHTWMLRNLPCRFDRAEIMGIIDGLGLAGKYNFFYLPIDIKKTAYRPKKSNANNKGYAFINLSDPADSDLLYTICHEKKFWEDHWRSNSKKNCLVSPANNQGFYENVLYYKTKVLDEQKSTKAERVTDVGSIATGSLCTARSQDITNCRGPSEFERYRASGRCLNFDGGRTSRAASREILRTKSKARRASSVFKISAPLGSKCDDDDDDIIGCSAPEHFAVGSNDSTSVGSPGTTSTGDNIGFGTLNLNNVNNGSNSDIIGGNSDPCTPMVGFNSGNNNNVTPLNNNNNNGFISPCQSFDVNAFKNSFDLSGAVQCPGGPFGSSNNPNAIVPGMGASHNNNSFGSLPGGPFGQNSFNAQNSAGLPFMGGTNSMSMTPSQSFAGPIGTPGFDCSANFFGANNGSMGFAGINGSMGFPPVNHNNMSNWGSLNGSSMHGSSNPMSPSTTMNGGNPFLQPLAPNSCLTPLNNSLSGMLGMNSSNNGGLTPIGAPFHPSNGPNSPPESLNPNSPPGTMHNMYNSNMNSPQSPSSPLYNPYNNNNVNTGFIGENKSGFIGEDLKRDSLRRGSIADCGKGNGKRGSRRSRNSLNSVRNSHHIVMDAEKVEEMLAQVAQTPYIWYPKSVFDDSDDFVLWIAGDTNLSTQE